MITWQITSGFAGHDRIGPSPVLLYWFPHDGVHTQGIKVNRTLYRQLDSVLHEPGQTVQVPALFCYIGSLFDGVHTQGIKADRTLYRQLDSVLHDSGQTAQVPTLFCYMGSLFNGVHT